MHKSATCSLILAEDRQEEDEEDGTLEKVALKCMKNLNQFLTELRVRVGLDGGKVISALRVHVPPDFRHEAIKEATEEVEGAGETKMTPGTNATPEEIVLSQGGSDMEPEPEMDRCST